MKRAVLFSTATLIGLLVTDAVRAQPGSMTVAAIKGTYKCKLTAYGLPTTAKDPFTQTASGDVEIVADGAGNWSSGSFDEQIESQDLHANCKLQLTSGTYSVNGDGRGTSTVKWQLNKSASTSSCQQFGDDPRQEPSSERLIV